MVSLLAKVKFFRFWPKTMDYNKAFLPKSRSFFVVLLLHSGRFYGAEICTILFLLRCPFIWYPFWPKSKFSDFGLKPWTIIRRFYRNRGHSLWSFYSTVEGAMELKFACEMHFHMVSFLVKVRFWLKSMYILKLNLRLDLSIRLAKHVTISGMCLYSMSVQYVPLG